MLMPISDVIKAITLSTLAYSDLQPNFPETSLLCIDDPETDVQCYARVKGDCLNIAFRGSSSVQDWITNIAVPKKAIPYGNPISEIRVHSGFLKAYKSPAVREAIHRVMTADVNHVLITGHSLGGALSILCAVDLEYNFPDKDYEVILFGAPRVGNRAFQQSYHKRVPNTIRFENGNDMVSKLPSASMGYCHVGKCIHIGKVKNPYTYSIKDHFIQSYFVNVLRCLDDHHLD